MANFKNTGPDKAAEAGKQDQQARQDRLDREHEDQGREQHESTLAASAAGVLATAQDPLNKALRGVGDHLQHKVDQISHQTDLQQDDFYQRLGLSDPSHAPDTPQLDQPQAIRENNGPELDF